MTPEQTVPFKYWRTHIVRASQPALAQRMGVRVQTIARWEAGPGQTWRRIPAPKHMQTLQRVSKGRVNALSFEDAFLSQWSAENAD